MPLNKQNAAAAHAALSAEISKQGISASFLPLAMLQLSHETAGFNSRVSRVNNLSGIKYVKQAYAKDSGIVSPEGNNYAAYNSYNDWAKDYLRIIKRMGADKASSIAEFAAILKKKGYYTDTQKNYEKGLISWRNQVGKMFSDVAGVIANNPGTTIIAILLLTFLIIK